MSEQQLTNRYSDGQVQEPTGGAAPAGTPVQQISDGQVQNPTGAAAASSAPAAAAPSSGAAAASSKGAAAAPTTGGAATSAAAPYPSTSPAARPEASTSGSFGNTTNISPTPYEGGAGAASTVGVATLVLSVVIGVVAFAL